MKVHNRLNEYMTFPMMLYYSIMFSTGRWVITGRNTEYEEIVSWIYIGNIDLKLCMCILCSYIVIKNVFTVTSLLL